MMGVDAMNRVPTGVFVVFIGYGKVDAMNRVPTGICVVFIGYGKVDAMNRVPTGVFVAFMGNGSSVPDVCIVIVSSRGAFRARTGHRWLR